MHGCPEPYVEKSCSLFCALCTFNWWIGKHNVSMVLCPLSSGIAMPHLCTYIYDFPSGCPQIFWPAAPQQCMLLRWNRLWHLSFLEAQCPAKHQVIEIGTNSSLTHSAITQCNGRQISESAAKLPRVGLRTQRPKNSRAVGACQSTMRPFCVGASQMRSLTP